MEIFKIRDDLKDSIKKLLNLYEYYFSEVKIKHIELKVKGNQREYKVFNYYTIYIGTDCKDEEENSMKKIIYKYSNVISAFALFMTTLAVNRACTMVMNEPELPSSANHLRKF